MAVHHFNKEDIPNWLSWSRLSEQWFRNGYRPQGSGLCIYLPLIVVKIYIALKILWCAILLLFPICLFALLNFNSLIKKKWFYVNLHFQKIFFWIRDNDKWLFSAFQKYMTAITKFFLICLWHFEKKSLISFT